MLKLVSDFEGGWGLVNKVCTLLQWDREARGGGFLYSQTPYLSTYVCKHKYFSLINSLLDVCSQVEDDVDLLQESLPVTAAEAQARGRNVP